MDEFGLADLLRGTAEAAGFDCDSLVEKYFSKVDRVMALDIRRGFPLRSLDDYYRDVFAVVERYAAIYGKK